MKGHYVGLLTWLKFCKRW